MSAVVFRLGIDFGTSNTVAALIGPDGRIRPMLFDGSPLLPSAVFAGDGSGLLCGWDALRAAAGNPAGLELNPKRRIDDGTMWLADHELPVSQVVATVLGRVATEARRVAGRGADLQVVVTHPAAWARTRLSVLAQAAELAGIGPVQFVPEPVAAAAYFASVVQHPVAAERAIVVYDLGGGTFDVSVVRPTPDGFVVIATDGLPDVGGVDLDAVVVRHARTLTAGDGELWRRLDWPGTLAEQQARQALWRGAQAVKEQLSRHAIAELYVPLIDRVLHLTRTEFETAALPYLDRTVRLTRQVLVQAAVPPEDIGGVFLVGGSSRIPLAATLLHRTLRVAPTIIDQPELVVAEGALLSVSATMPIHASASATSPAVSRSEIPPHHTKPLTTMLGPIEPTSMATRTNTPAPTAPDEPGATVESSPRTGVVSTQAAGPPARQRTADDSAPERPQPTVALKTLAAPTANWTRRHGKRLTAAAIAVLVLAAIGIFLTDTRPPENSDSGTPAIRTNTPAPAAKASRASGNPQLVSADRPTVKATAPVGAEPQGVAVSPDSHTVYIADQGAHVLSIMDAGTRTVTSVPLRGTPRFVATTPDGTRVYVSMYEDDTSGSSVAVVDAASRTIRTYVNTGTQPYALAVAPDGQLWVPIHSEHRVEIYAPDEQRQIATVDVPSNPHSVAFSASLKRAFTPNHESNSVSVIDMNTNQVIQSLPVSAAPHNLAISPDGRTIAVACYQADAVDLIDTTTLQRTGPYPVGHHPRSVAFSTDGNHAYVVNEGGNSLSVIDAHTGKVTATLAVGASPRTIAVAPDGRFAYVSNGASDTVSILELPT